MRILSPSDYRAMPWKNGLGQTTEIVAYPEPSAYDWRLSIADVAADGPFSRFPGMDRVIVQLRGAPIRLAHAGTEATLALFWPHVFSGDWDTSSVLTGGPAQDFNVITRRGAVSSLVTTIAATNDTTINHGRVAPRQTVAIYVVAGDVQLPSANGMIVAPQSTVLFEPDDAVHLATRGPATLIIAYLAAYPH